MKLFGKGVISGVLTVFLINAIQLGFEGSALLYIAICVILFGILPGGIGGVVLGKIFKKYSWAAYLGGILVSFLLIPIYPFFWTQ
jgi:hypothetical protein